jgi:ABC transporter substrate binding protein (PQQ-dependent alcohol dehydrogenase system)
MEFWSTTRAAAVALLALCGSAAVVAAQDQPAPRPLTIAYLDREADPWYAVVNGRDGVFRPTRKSARPGAELGIKDVAVQGRALGIVFKLEPRTLGPDEPLGPVLKDLASSGTAAAILDLPEADLRAAADSNIPDLALFDIRSRGDGLRAATCTAPLFHMLPSTGAQTDAIVQFLVKRNWKRILVLYGPEPEDKETAEAVQASAKKFGGKIVDTKAFAISNDPRRREETNLTLLSGGTGEYDVVFVADAQGDVGRSIPFRIALPRPVVGSEGLSASAWHPYYERNGAPQLNRRFERLAGFPMTDEAWSAWVAVRAVAEASATGLEEPLPRRLMRQGLTLELYKGYPGSFRPWDRSLRQAVLLGTHNAVIDLAPIEGFLHETNVLDTLGLLPSQTPCGKRP